MSIRWDKRNKRWRFEFDRYVHGRRTRTSRLLPQGWSQAQADAFDRAESGRLYAVAVGIEQSEPLIDTAVALYLQDKATLKSFKPAAQHLAAIAWAYFGRPISALPIVARDIAEKRLIPATEKGRGEHVLSMATARNRIALLKAACRHAWKAHGLTESDPTTRMQLPAVNTERHVYADRRQMLELARAADRRDVRAMIRAAFYTGMRLGELERVRLEHDRLVLDDTKNGTRRVIPLHPRVRVLLRYLPLPTPRITLQRGFQRARVRAGLPHIRIHDLRHSAASEMVNAGVDLFTVGRVLGHKDQRSTARYSHHTADTLADAIGRIGGRKSPHKPQAAGTKKAA
jgi:integrase